tara:strand:- start:1658 stop:2467 length:810 start_codon:yes stop_codon:yes gene_type:complete
MLGLGSSIVSANTLDTAYVNTHSFSLDGTGDYIDTNSTMQSTMQSANGHTFGIWFRPGDVSGLQVLFGGVGSDFNAGQFLIYINNTAFAGLYRAKTPSGTSNFEGWSLNASTTPAFTAVANKWHGLWVATDVSGTNIEVKTYYIIQDTISLQIDTETTVMTSAAMQNIQMNNNMFVGAYNNNGSGIYQFNGQLDQVCVWNKNLSAQEIANLSANPNADYSTDFGGYAASSNLVHYYKADNNVIDFGSGSSNATLVNDATFTSSNLPITT